MEIRIRTADEFHANHVTIEIRAVDQEEAAQVAERLAGPGYWANAAEVAERRVRELEQELATAQHAREIETRRAKEQVQSQDEARRRAVRQAEEWDRDRHTERDRADRAEADLRDLKQRTAKVAEELAEAEQSIQALADLLGKVNGLALGNDVRKALGKNWETADGRAISEALRGIRDVLGAWTPRSV